LQCCYEHLLNCKPNTLFNFTTDCGPVQKHDPDVMHRFDDVTNEQTTTYNSTLTFECVLGYHVGKGVTIAAVRCTDEGRWEELHGCVIQGR